MQDSETSWYSESLYPCLISGSGKFFRVIHFAEFNVITNQFSDRRILAADGAVLIAIDFQLTELHAERVVHQQATDERFADSEQHLDSFSRHHETNYAWEHAQDAGLISAGHHARRRWRWIHAPIARTFAWFKNGRLSFKLEDTTVYDSLIRQHRSIID